MEDEEDLEFLRLAALKSLNNKKEPAPTTHNSIKKQIANGDDYHVIPVVNSVRPIDEYYVSAPLNRIQPNIVHHPIGPYLSSGFEKIDINEQYIPQRVNQVPQVNNTFADYTPFGTASLSASASTNVQLSPRSAAFVLQNNDILMRRKGGISPCSPRSHSPTSYRKSPGRWSVTPPPIVKKLTSRSPKHSPSYEYRRSLSRSPNRKYNRNRSISRSPQRRRHSPVSQHMRRTKSRSPIVRASNSGNNNHRAVAQRSPIQQQHNNNSRRANSPSTIRNTARGWRGNSPSIHHRNVGPQPRRSISPGGVDNANYRSLNRRRTRSPAIIKHDVRRRSVSRSPNRKYQRNLTNANRRRRTPTRKFNNNRNNPNGRNNNSVRNRNNTRRSMSPLNNQRPSSRTSPLHQKANSDKRQGENDANDKNQLTSHDHKITEGQSETTTNDKNSRIENDSNAIENKKEQKIEDDLLASTDDDKSDSDNGNDDDGIDLFASEESESENEGRFKSHSGKSERTANVSTVPFSKLGTAVAAPAEILRDLDEVQSGNSSSFRKENKERGDRDRDRNGPTRSGYRRDGRYNSRKPGTDNKDRRDRDRERDRDNNRNRNSTWKNSKGDIRKKEIDLENNAEKERKPTMFKSTFQAVDTETRNKTTDDGKLA